MPLQQVNDARQQRHQGAEVLLDGLHATREGHDESVVPGAGHRTRQHRQRGVLQPALVYRVDDARRFPAEPQHMRAATENKGGGAGVGVPIILRANWFVDRRPFRNTVGDLGSFGGGVGIQERERERERERVGAAALLVVGHFSLAG